jgi:TP53 regulating kinase-like protein/N6-L-threonylcarbamoyladenine synthase/protein kinase Bud32
MGDTRAMESEQRIGMGAEAVIEGTEYLGHRAVLKRRPRKDYRHPELDARLRSGRTRNEVRIIREARCAGVRTPVVYDVDVAEGSITMEYVEGERVREIIESEPARIPDICRMIGETMAKMHNAGICHGDLTTSNMILTASGELCILDFSMGSTRCDVEGKGVDIHLLERAFTSSHSKATEAFGMVMDAYMQNADGAKEIARRVEDIKGRARYT